jgi:polar amino acid transport system substrate-binding protein
MKQPIKSLVVTAASAALILASSASFAAGHTCTNDTWNKVMKRGKMVVGVKADYKPWGYRDTGGAIVGMEADMAKMAGDAMGVEVELVAVQSSNRMQFLENGKIDLMIATMSDRVDAKIVAFTGNAEAKQALRDKKCIAWVYDDSSIMSDLSSGNYDSYEMPLMSEDDNPWGLAVPLAEKDCIFGNFMSGLTFNMHQSGKLIELEKKWGIQATQYLKDQNKRFADWIQ